MSHHGAHAHPQSNDDFDFVDLDLDTSIDHNSNIPAADTAQTILPYDTSDWSTKPTAPESRIVIGGDNIPLTIGERVWCSNGLAVMILSIERDVGTTFGWSCRDLAWCSFRNDDGKLDYDYFEANSLFHQPISDMLATINDASQSSADESTPGRERLFTVIDTRTNAAPNLKQIALYEPWAKRLVWCDMDGFYLDEYGELLLADECGNYAICPEGRFEIRFSNLASA